MKLWHGAVLAWLVIVTVASTLAVEHDNRSRPTTYYVDKNGSDDNDCTAKRPCRTIGAALRLIPSPIKRPTTVNIAPGVYAVEDLVELGRFDFDGGYIEVRGDKNGGTYIK